MSCLDDSSVQRWAEGTLSVNERQTIMAHVDGCANCRALLAAMARAATSGPNTATGRGTPHPWVSEILPKGTQVGRYVIDHMVGAGGMGVVYAAYDPHLDRRVAIKFEKAVTDESPAARQARLSAEAKAMARLHSPYVVPVHDVGLFKDEMFVAMALVDGVNLRTWLTQSPRAQADVLRMFVQAGRGLAAAHHAGLVHGDFKPHNVLVTADGRALVTDFGLTRHANAAHDPDGGLRGTPRYMAPEQLKGASGTQRSDQFSFCMALLEALNQTAQPTPLDHAPQVAQVRPAALRRLLARGLHQDPERRHPAMDVLVAALERQLRPRHVLRAMVAAAMVLMVAAPAWWWQQRHVRAQRCAHMAQAAQNAWGLSQQQAVTQGFGKVKQPYTARALATVDASLSEYIRRWQQQVESACQQALVEHAVPQETWQTQQQCFERGRIHLGTVVDLLSNPDDALVENAGRVPSMLLAIEDCQADRVQAFAEALPAQPTARATAEQAYRRLANADTLVLAGRQADAQDEVRAAQQQATSLTFMPLDMAVQQQLGAVLLAKGQFAPGREALHQAVLHAESLGNTQVEAIGWIQLAFTWRELGDRHRARAALDHAVALSHRTTLSTRWYTRMATVNSILFSDAGQYSEALAVTEKALAHVQALPDAHAQDLALLHGVRGAAAMVAGREAESEESFRRGLDLLTSMTGPVHPAVGNALLNLAYTVGLGRDRQEGLRILAQAEEVMQATLAPEHAAWAIYHGARTELLKHAGRFAEAAAAATEGLERCLKTYGQGHWRCAGTRADLGAALLALGQNAKAREHFVRTMKDIEGADDVLFKRFTTTITHQSLAELDLAANHLGPAWDHAESAVNASPKSCMPIYRARAHATAARVALALGHTGLARDHARQAQASFQRAIAFTDQAQLFAHWVSVKLPPL